MKIKNLTIGIIATASTAMNTLAAGFNMSVPSNNGNIIPSWQDGISTFLSTPVGVLGWWVLLFMGGFVVFITIAALFKSQGDVAYGTIFDKSKRIIQGQHNGGMIAICFVVLIVLLAFFKFTMSMQF